MTKDLDALCGTVTHDEAEEAVHRMIASHFNKIDTEHMRASIPANPKRDDDLRVLAYIQQQRKASAKRANVAGLEAQNAVLREALEENHLTFQRLNLHPCVGTEAYYALDRSYQKTRKAISLTPSDAAEMVSKRDDLLREVVRRLETIKQTQWRDSNFNNYDAGYLCQLCDKAIEAARAAGVEV